MWVMVKEVRRRLGVENAFPRAFSCRWRRAPKMKKRTCALFPLIFFRLCASNLLGGTARRLKMGILLLEKETAAGAESGLAAGNNSKIRPYWEFSTMGLSKTEFLWLLGVFALLAVAAGSVAWFDSRPDPLVELNRAREAAGIAKKPADRGANPSRPERDSRSRPSPGSPERNAPSRPEQSTGDSPTTAPGKSDDIPAPKVEVETAVGAKTPVKPGGPVRVERTGPQSAITVQGSGEPGVQVFSLNGVEVSPGSLGSGGTFRIVAPGGDGANVSVVTVDGNQLEGAVMTYEAPAAAKK